MHEISEYTLTLINNWISNIDNKTSYGLSAAGVLSGFVLIHGAPKAFTMWTDKTKTFFVALISTIAVILLYIALLTAICLFIGSLWARIHKSTGTSYVFFGDIAEMEPNNFYDKFSELDTNNNYEKQLTEQIFQNSCICKKKSDLYNKGLIALIVASVLCFVCMTFQLI